MRESVKTAQLRVKAKQENVSGVQLPAFEMTVDGQNGVLFQFSHYDIAFELTGLGRGGQQVQKCKDTYQKAVQILVELASLQVQSLLRIRLIS